mmetsp:Transcript_11362/g.28735  ORF Transcript_11362/g.28735 Transcript_11362/m.28735 type:complete len:261 (+) Transcript_11362:1054-1836(+)
MCVNFFFVAYIVGIESKFHRVIRFLPLWRALKFQDLVSDLCVATGLANQNSINDNGNGIDMIWSPALHTLEKTETIPRFLFQTMCFGNSPAVFGTKEHWIEWIRRQIKETNVALELTKAQGASIGSVIPVESGKNQGFPTISVTILNPFTPGNFARHRQAFAPPLSFLYHEFNLVWSILGFGFLRRPFFAVLLVHRKVIFLALDVAVPHLLAPRAHLELFLGSIAIATTSWLDLNFFHCNILSTGISKLLFGLSFASSLL